MRYEFTIRHLARLWLDIAPMSAVSEAVFQEIRGLTGRDDLTPGFATESLPGSSAQRAALTGQDGLIVLFPGESFDVLQVPVVRGGVDEGTTTKTFAEFATLAGRVLGSIARKYSERPGRRLACVQEGFLYTPAATLEELPRRVFQVPEPFRTHGSFEWDWRLATRLERSFGGLQEPLNTIVTLKRVSGTIVGGQRTTKFDRARLDFDISSSHERMEPRFNAEQIDAFFTSSVDWHSELWRQMERGLRIEDR